MESVWYDGPSGDEHVFNPTAEWVNGVMQLGAEYWGEFSPVCVLSRHEAGTTASNRGTATQISQVLIVRHPERGWYLEYSSKRPPRKWLVAISEADKESEWVRHWAYGDETYFLSKCFVSQSIAERVVLDYLNGKEPFGSDQWVDFEGMSPRRDDIPHHS